MSTGTNLVRVGIIVSISGLLMALLIVLFDRPQVGDQLRYHALFRDVSGLSEGEDVKASGVVVGQVRSVELDDDGTLRVSFSAAPHVPLTTSSTATIRYANLLGDRFLELGAGEDSTEADPLAPDATISEDHTFPALDLDELYSGFAPLFQGLDPEQVNELSAALIAVFQGQSGALEHLLGNLGELTGELADHDQLIGSLITELNSVLGTVNARTPELSSLVDEVDRLVAGLAQDRDPIGESFARISGFTEEVSGLLTEARPEVRGLVTELKRLLPVLHEGRPTIEENLRRAPRLQELLGRVGGYASAFNFYICGLRLHLDGPTSEGILTPFIRSEVERCQG
ncbi:phospholipid/cholesterol/gamma-HCH transport system substrate-binding protein [Amycolatopsis marina]|uniref:Phospholipid/cholesterol/gamma-HCH transport system substrate-binding protein n=1 Tax=Amycolatopsis marina TaxID=490629 RepID=A0A1I0YMH5_9PSEU|nr:MlaD family protein [Amycolatopsis marina]SFB13333.1 phospholipid/cholesterol/gamma-HCH transport system substrate-binding protein [Amycolatopsis marina]